VNPQAERRGDFIETAMRRYCRNPRCRTKLPVPVSNEREAFCTKGCHHSFYLRRCLVCEQPIEQPKRGRRFICKKAKCRNAWRAGLGFGRYVPSDAELTRETPDSIGANGPLNPDRRWHIVAGPQLSASAFYCATLGGAEAVANVNRTNVPRLRDYNAKIKGKQRLLLTQIRK
jgi:hypothetical protein